MTRNEQSKWGLIGWIKKELKIKGNEENGKAGSLRDKSNTRSTPVQTTSSPAPSTSIGGTDKATPNPEKEPEQTESEAAARKIIVVQTIEVRYILLFYHFLSLPFFLHFLTIYFFIFFCCC